MEVIITIRELMSEYIDSANKGGEFNGTWYDDFVNTIPGLDKTIQKYKENERNATETERDQTDNV